MGCAGKDHMKNRISEVTIRGLWGREEAIKFTFDQHVNFIIGRNGTGKTTVINLIAAVLLADFERLDKILFSSVLIKLHPSSGRTRPTIQVTKIPKKDLPYSDISFRIKLAPDQVFDFDLDAYAEERAYRGAPTRFMRDRIYRDKFISVQRQLQEVINVTWLSVYRGIEERERGEDRKYQSAVDQKLATLNIELVKYFTRLATAFEGKTTEFQRSSFLSLIRVEKGTNLRSFINKIDVQHERAALASIFKLLGVAADQYEEQLTDNATHFKKAAGKLKTDPTMTIEDSFLIFNAYRAHGLVELYETLQKQSAVIFGPRQVFLDVVNGLLRPRKQASLSVTNELVVMTGKDKVIQLEELSSGEKQLLIILGQALLQEEQTAIYIADEPELSLHVEWQEQITSAITRLNPNAQIIFATHSPDIVGRHSEHVLDMELFAA